MRNKKNADQRIAALSDYLIGDISLYKPIQPIHMEIGCGKGAFITETAARNKDINFLAIEKYSSVAVLAMEKAANTELQNIKFAITDISEFKDMQYEHFCDRIYLNFSDPWPRKRHVKRRLTYKSFLELYKKLLKQDGEIYLKTDNKDFFDFSLQSFEENGFRLENITYDLHSENNEFNIMTEYEKRFSEEGIKICRVEAYLV